MPLWTFLVHAVIRLDHEPRFDPHRCENMLQRLDLESSQTQN